MDDDGEPDKAYFPGKGSSARDVADFVVISIALDFAKKVAALSHEEQVALVSRMAHTVNSKVGGAYERVRSAVRGKTAE